MSVNIESIEMLLNKVWNLTNFKKHYVKCKENI